jgi:DNA polymerase-3 subunit alpha
MLMRKLQVDTYLGLVAASSVIRPGVSKSGMMRAYIERHRNPKKRKEAHPILLKLMPETYGVMVYQEDVIKVAHHFAGLDLGEADVLRRGMSGKFRSREEFAKARDTFIQRALERGRPSDLVHEVWKQVESFAGYAFAKGHSASYAVESYQSLFLKAHWPLEYMTACINNFGGFYRTEFYIHEARMVGATIEAPCINKGHWDATVYPSKLRIYLGFNLVRGIEAQTIHLLMQNRAQYGPFKSMEDTLKRVRLPLEQCLLLIRCGGFQFTKMSKQKLLWEAHFLIGNRSPSTSEITLFDPTPQRFNLPNLESSILEDAFDHIELFGFPLVSPFLLLTPESTRLANKSATSDALSHCIGQMVDVVGYLVTVKETVTSTGSRMCFGCFLDRDGAWLDTVHFPTSLQRFRFRGKGVYQIKGYVREEYGCHHVEVAWMEKLAYTADPRYAEDALTGQNLPPANTRHRSRNTLRANSNGGQLKRQINSDSS